MPPRAKQRRSELPTAEEEAHAVDDRKIMCQFVDEYGNKTGAQALLPVTATTAQLEEIVAAIMGKEEPDAPLAFFLDDEQILTSISEHLHHQQKESWREKMLAEGRRFRPKDVDAVPLDVPAEATLTIAYRPQAVFKVRAVSRSAASLDGHSEAVLVVSFSPDGLRLATGSGDKTIRLWDILTCTPTQTLETHRNWVQVLAWSPDNYSLASGSRDGGLVVWRPKLHTTIDTSNLSVTTKSDERDEAKSIDENDGKVKSNRIVVPDEEQLTGTVFAGHSDFLTQIAWEPIHLAATFSSGHGLMSKSSTSKQHFGAVVDRFVSASKDKSMKIWRVSTGRVECTLNGHQAAVTSVKWGGHGHIYSSSQDRNVMIWNSNTGYPLQTLVGHAHWVNTVALNTDAVLRSGWYDHEQRSFAPQKGKDELMKGIEYAKSRFEKVLQLTDGHEVLASCSDDFTTFLWKQSKSPYAAGNSSGNNNKRERDSNDDNLNTSIAAVQFRQSSRLTGHQKLIFSLNFSPDGRWLASCSADNSIKLWDGVTGKFVHTYRGHVAPVYHITWSADSRLLISGSRDTTLKLWCVQTKTLLEDLPGHADEIFFTDWSPSGHHVATGSKDKTIKIWVH